VKAAGDVLLDRPLGHAAATDVVQPGGVGIDRGQDNAGPPRQGRELLGERYPVPVRQVDVDQDRVGLGLFGGAHRLLGAVGLRRDPESGVGQDAPCQLAKSGVVVDHENRGIHADDDSIARRGIR